jgi:hypothetical protein
VLVEKRCFRLEDALVVEAVLVHVVVPTAAAIELALGSAGSDADGRRGRPGRWPLRQIKPGVDVLAARCRNMNVGSGLF